MRQPTPPSKIETTNPKIKAAKENALFQLGLAEHTKGQYTAALDHFHWQ